MVQVGAQPNVRADQHAIAEGMAVESINRLGPLDHDLYAGIGLFGRLLPVGFYYKTFYWPRGVWQHLFERPIRIMAGLGKLKPARRTNTTTRPTCSPTCWSSAAVRPASRRQSPRPKRAPTRC